MTTYIINPNASNIDATIIVNIEALEIIGYDFDEYHQNTTNELNILFNEARQKNIKENDVEIHLQGNINNLQANYSWYNHVKKNYLGWKEIPNVERLIEDIIFLIENDMLKYNADFTTNKVGEYVPTFIKF